MSIFRYPGGKTKLSKRIADAARNYAIFAEPFAGGGSVFSRVLRDTSVPLVLINDADEWMFDFWSVIFDSDASQFDELVRTIEDTPVTIQTFLALRSTDPDTTVDKAFRALFFNRTTFSGIRTSGPIGGYTQHSKYTVDCRFNKPRIIKEMRELRSYRNRVHVSGFDFEAFFDTLPNSGTFVYADPPYYVKGDQLYPERMNDADHERLAACLRGKDYWLSYDAHPYIYDLYQNWADVTDVEMLYTIGGNGRKNSKMTEYLIKSRG